jgi:hypothetical protein
MVSCVLSSSIFAGKESGITKSALIKEANFLAGLLRLEFVTKPTESSQDDFAAAIDTMVDRGILSYSKDADPIVHLTDRGEGHVNFVSQKILQTS